MHGVPLVVYVHMTAALTALVLGTVQLARPKGTYSHKTLGWVWVTLMLTVAVSSLWIPSFLHFTWIHLFTALTQGVPALKRRQVSFATANLPT